MSKRKTRTSMADQNNHGSSKTAEGGSGKAARVTPVPEGARRPPPTPTASDDTSSYDVSVPFEFRNWQVGSRFHIKRFLGRGSYGSVCEATDKLTGERVAIKRITDLFDVKENAKRIFREIRLLHLLQHPNIIRIVHLHMPKRRKFNDLYIVFECMDTDFGKLTYDTTQYLTIAHVRWLLYQTLLGLKYLHSAGVIHRDLKPANILITASCDLKVCDFGLARSVGDTDADDSDTETGKDDDDEIAPPMIHRQLTRHVVTRWYRAPELMLYNDGDYTTAIDVWSLGCCLGEMLGMLENRDEDDMPIEREALFPGSSCYPLSGSAASPEGTSSRLSARNDQLSVIFDVLGRPDETTVKAARTEEAAEYLRSLGTKARGKKSLEERFPAATEEVMDLLRRMLVITPEHRITIDEALRHDFLKPVWREDEEVTRKHMINFNLIKPGEDVRQLVYKEVMRYNTDPATRTCEVPFKGVLDTRAGAVPPLPARETGTGAGAGAGAGGGTGVAARAAAGATGPGDAPGSATSSTGSLNAKMSATGVSGADDDTPPGHD